MLNICSKAQASLLCFRVCRVKVHNYSTSARRQEIPEIDFRYFNTNLTAQRDIVEQVKSACSDIGFMYAKNVDGLPQDLIDSCLYKTARFFALPQSSKNGVRTSEKNTRGYYKFTGSGAAASSNIEAFLMGNDSKPPWQLREEYFKRTKSTETLQSLPVNQPNQWPDQGQFREIMNEYWNGCCIASNTILQALALSLGLSKDYFTEMHKKKDCSMELKKYPPTRQPQFHTRLPPHLAGLKIPKAQDDHDDEQLAHRFNEHSDLSSITLLIQTPEIDCLEVKTTANKWIKARAYPGSVLVNTGDVMERWTNGIYPSTRHRVVTNKDQAADRYSVVFFCMPDWETQIAPINIPKFPTSSSQNTNSFLFGDLIPFA
eukprot:Phypoly_transcript_10544.p1 GENE.Phypoly_transcript_10544~~Phypoly_transcript_10544.p1  ORF type:complete len:373 (+),score=34.27 Phypoly_transcript_10544:126-1244(+)